jgi:arginine decarboxylase-like protein
VGLTVDHQTTGSADPLPTIVVESDRILPSTHQTLVEEVEHFEERHLIRDFVDLIGLEPSS